MTQKPSIGRIVLYSDGEEVSASIITAVQSDSMVSLTVFPQGSLPTCVFDVSHFTGEAFGDEFPPAGTWHWPPRV